MIGGAKPAGRPVNEEKLKDIRNMLDLISKDYQRLADDVKCLSEVLYYKDNKHRGCTLEKKDEKLPCDDFDNCTGCPYENEGVKMV